MLAVVYGHLLTFMHERSIDQTAIEQSFAAAATDSFELLQFMG